MIDRRNAHQPLDRQFQLIAAIFEKAAKLSRTDAGLLRLYSSIDLNKQLHVFVLRLHFAGDRFGDLWSIQRFDHVENSHSLRRLVRLQRPDQMQFDVGKIEPQAWPFFLSLLHAVFAEDTLTRRQYGTDMIGVESFGNAD